MVWWLGLLACALALVGIHDLRSAPRPAIMILLVGGLVYAAACRWLHRNWSERRSQRPRDPVDREPDLVGAAPAAPPDTTRLAVVAIVVGGALLRLAVVAVPPSLSDDVYRYRWDGRVQAAGLNPYAEPPASESLAPLRDELWQEINYPRIRTIYPPLAQWLFALVYQLHDGLLGFQLLAVLGDMLVVVLLLALLRHWRLPGWRVAIYAWSPLAVVESASSAHFDPLTMAAVLAALLAALRGARLLSTLSLAAGVLLKTWPLVFAPLGLRGRRWWHAALFVGLVGGAYLPYLSGAGAGVLQAWLEYTGRWRFNDAGFAVLRLLTGGSEPAAKAIAAFLGLALLRWLWHRDADPVRGGYWLLQAFVLLMPAIHPWYLLWPLPLAAVCLDAGWILLTVLAPLAYWILVGAGPDSNLWVEPTWVRFVLYLPPAAVWLLRALRDGPPAPPAADDAV